MKIYRFNLHGAYVGEEEIAEGASVPEGATPIAPPELSAGQVAIFAGHGWMVSDMATWIETYVRPERNRRLEAADQRVRRHDYQLRAGVATTDSAQTIAAVLNYMQELRDLPETAQPESFAWPGVP